MRAICPTHPILHDLVFLIIFVKNQNGSGAHPASYPMGIRGSFPGVKRPGREADHSPTSSAEVKE
jgi:hypothetical protein